MMRRLEAVIGSASWALSSALGWSPSSPSYRGVALIDSSSSGYFSLLQSALPALPAASSFSQIQALTCLVHNGGSNAIRAYSVRWHVGLNSGRTLNYQRQALIRPGGRYLLTAEFPILNPGETHAVTPFAIWSSLVTAPNSAANGLSVDLSQYLSDPSVASITDAASIQTMLDCAIDEVHMMDGPDTLNLRQRVITERNAQHDEGLSVMHSLNANDNEATLLRKINYHRTLALSSGNNLHRAQHLTARADCARLLLGIYKRSGRAELAKAATRLSTIHRTRILGTASIVNN